MSDLRELLHAAAPPAPEFDVESLSAAGHLARRTRLRPFVIGIAVVILVVLVATAVVHAQAGPPRTQRTPAASKDSVDPVPQASVGALARCAVGVVCLSGRRGAATAGAARRSRYGAGVRIRDGRRERGLPVRSLRHARDAPVGSPSRSRVFSDIGRGRARSHALRGNPCLQRARTANTARHHRGPLRRSTLPDRPRHRGASRMAVHLERRGRSRSRTGGRAVIAVRCTCRLAPSSKCRRRARPRRSNRDDHVRRRRARPWTLHGELHHRPARIVDGGRGQGPRDRRHVCGRVHPGSLVHAGRSFASSRHSTCVATRPTRTCRRVDDRPRGHRTLTITTRSAHELSLPDSHAFR